VHIALILVGFGHVARRFVRLLDESRATFSALDVQPVITAVITRRHGHAFRAAGLDEAALLALDPSSDAGITSSLPLLTDTLDRLRFGDFIARVMVETTTLDARSGEPAIAHVRAALAGDAHVVTANKGPAAFAYRELAADAEARGRSFLFEGAVMDGVPVFNLVRETMPGVTVRGFRGVVNSTTNYMLTALERGESFEAALARMQADGIAEADPSLDIDGWDAAAKAAVLANVLLGADTTPPRVRREGLTAATAARALAASGRGRRLKLVASGRGRGADADVRVELAELATDDALAMLDGQANAIELDTWPLGRVMLTQHDGGLEKTAYALVSDLVTVARRIRGVSP
jgi:homoserine dehydrogenase